MSGLTGIINRALSTTPGWEGSSILPLQRRVGPAPAPVMGTDESGRTQAFNQPGLAFGLPSAISSPVQSLVNSAGKLEQGQVPDTKDVMPFLLAAGAPSLGSEGGAALSAGARFTREIRPSKENLANIIDANFSHGGKVVGNKLVSVDSLEGGVGPSADDARRVKSLANQIEGPNGYFERIVVDQNGNVIEGQHRLDAAKLLGYKDIPVTELRDNATGFDTNAMMAATKGMGLHPSQQNKVVEQALDTLHKTGSQEAALEYEIPGFDDAFQAAIKAAQPNGLINRPNITPGSIAAEHALDMTTNDRLAAEAAKPKEKK